MQCTVLASHAVHCAVQVTSSVVPIRAQALGGCALEGSFRGGVKREVLRSLCQVHNATQLPLQVALATLPPASEWQEVPRQASSGRQQRRSSQVHTRTGSPSRSTEVVCG